MQNSDQQNKATPSIGRDRNSPGRYLNDFLPTACDTAWINANIVTMCDDGSCRPGNALRTLMQSNGRIVFIGEQDDLQFFTPRTVIDCEGRFVLPGLIDCHTHLAHGRSDYQENASRPDGCSCAGLKQSGHAVHATTCTGASDTLIEGALSRVDALIAEGVTTIEMKSGDGLDFDSEIKQLECAHQLGQMRDVRIKSTYLSQHTMPQDARHDPHGYVQFLINDMLPYIKAHQIADYIDALREKMAFEKGQISRFPKAARYGALSARHIEHTDEEGVLSMRNAGTIAVLLPAAFSCLNDAKKPPIGLLREHNVPIALGSDCNPGTSPCNSLMTAMKMGATLFGLEVQECVRGVTINAARALGIDDQVGSLQPGKICDLAIFDVESLEELVLSHGRRQVHSRVLAGRVV